MFAAAGFVLNVDASDIGMVFPDTEAVLVPEPEPFARTQMQFPCLDLSLSPGHGGGSPA